MATVPLKALCVLLLGGALGAFADDAGKAAAKAYSHSGKPASARAPGPGHETGKSVSSQAAAPGPGRMQVEEPAAGPANPEARAPRAWQKSHAKGLTEAQKTAFRERKRRMEGMIELIKAKRLALRNAKPEERTALARELHSLILEKDSQSAVASSTARVESQESAADGTKATAEAEAAEAIDKASEAKAQRREELRERQLDRLKRKKKDGED